MTERRIVIIMCVIAVVIVAIISLDCGAVARITQGNRAENVLMIDPGHGGMDSGAVSSSGTYEKDINLAIAKELGRMAESYGWQTVLTREADQWLCNTDEGSIRSRKTADLTARRELIRKYEPDLVVSIHLNSFTQDPSVSGAQVFYPGSGGEPPVLDSCRQLAQAVQQSLTDSLDMKKERTAMTKDDVFIFREVICPMVIVECGFLSNPQEAELLQSGEYQRMTAEAIMAGIADFTGVEKPQNIRIIDSLR